MVMKTTGFKPSISLPARFAADVNGEKETKRTVSGILFPPAEDVFGRKE